MIFSTSGRIRNFSVIAHIDHGKSTLADRILEITRAVSKRQMRAQFLDSMALERERGITIKLKAVRLVYFLAETEYQLNLIDTPGHVDFGYEVSRSLAACEGAVLVVDATQGIQAQTVANVYKALGENLKILTFINKVDLPQSRPDAVFREVIDTFGFLPEDIVIGSAKTGQNVDQLLKLIIKKIPSPKVTPGDIPLKALVFDSLYDSYLGALALVRIFEGQVRKGDRLKFIRGGLESSCLELGFYTPSKKETLELTVGEVGYIATGAKDLRRIKIGDTMTNFLSTVEALAGYKEPKPLVHLSLFTVSGEDFLKLRSALERIYLTDSSITFQPETSRALGNGFRCGFLGLLHADVLRERLEREYGLELITTLPSVSFLIETIKGRELIINSASDFPDPSGLKSVKEPIMRVSFFVPSRYLGAVMNLCQKSRGLLRGSEYFGQALRVEYELPLSEILFDFQDKLKSLTEGYASYDYEFLEFRSAEVFRLDILVAGELVEPLSQLIVREKAYESGKNLVSKLKELLPRQQFPVSLQASIDGKVVAREEIPAIRKNVLAKMSGGHRERKDKLLGKQKRGKEKLKRLGKVEIAKEVFTKLLQLSS